MAAENVDRKRLRKITEDKLRNNEQNVVSQNNIVELERTKEHITRELDNANKEIATLSNKINILQTQLEQWKQQHSIVNSENSKLKYEILSIKKDYDYLTQANNKLTIDNAAYLEIITNLSKTQ